MRVVSPASGVTVYGADWCEDTSRARRLLRRLAVPHRYLNVDDDLEALSDATALASGARRTPVVEVRGQALVEPSNDTLTSALVGAGYLTSDEIDSRLHAQNVGDAERMARVGLGAAMFLAVRDLPAGLRLPGRVLGLGLMLTGASGFCPIFQARRVSSIGGVGDRPGEAEHSAWLRPVPRDESTPA